MAAILEFSSTLKHIFCKESLIFSLGLMSSEVFYILAWGQIFKLTDLIVIGTECIGKCTAIYQWFQEIQNLNENIHKYNMITIYLFHVLWSHDQEEKCLI